LNGRGKRALEARRADVCDLVRDLLHTLRDRSLPAQRRKDQTIHDTFAFDSAVQFD
jgi:hypothetical protein